MKSPMDYTAIGNNIKYILFQNEIYTKHKSEILDFLKNKIYLSIGGENDEHYQDDDNIHHFLTNFYYKNASLIMRYLDIPFDENDFINIENFCDGQDFSYLAPLSNPLCRFTVSEYEMQSASKVTVYEGDIIVTCPFNDTLNKKVVNSEILSAINFPVETPYHRLFEFSHQTVTIENLNIKNNRHILISCDSYIIPLISLIIPYCETLTILDNRLFDYHHDFWIRKQYTDIIISLSYCYPLSKYIEQNF